MILAADLGGTRIKAGVVGSGRVMDRAVLDSQSSHGLAARLPELESTFRALAKDSPADAVVLAFPDLVDARQRKVLTVHDKYPDAKDLDLVGWAQTSFGLPLFLENDARLALLGEWSHGAGQGVENIVMITLGTGLGMAAVVDGRPLRGNLGRAGILGGHMTVALDGAKCVCGNIGCAEAEASTSVLEQRALEMDPGKTSSLWQKGAWNYRTVFDEADAGEPLAIDLRERSLAVWGALCINAVHAFDPEKIVLGGGIMGSASRILPRLQEWVDRHVYGSWNPPRLYSSELGDDAALLGAETLINEMKS